MSATSELDKCLGEGAELLLVESRLLDLLVSVTLDIPVEAYALEDRHEVRLRLTTGEEVGLEEAAVLEKLGLAERRIADRILRCPKCDSSRLTVKLKCPYCGAVNIEKVRIIQHVICGYIGVETEFGKAPGGELICPNCGVVLSTPADYRVLGHVYYCHSCRMRFHEPKLDVKCMRCGEVFPPVRAPYKPVYTLKPTKNAVKLIERNLDMHTVVYRVLSSLKKRFECKKGVEGYTGVMHIVDYLVEDRLVIDVLGDLSSHSVFTLEALKVRDTQRAAAAKGSSLTYVIVARRASEEAKQVLEALPDVYVIVETLPSRLERALKKLLEKLLAAQA